RKEGRGTGPVAASSMQTLTPIDSEKLRADQLERQLSERTRELRELSEVGIALSTERDHSVLLTTILSKARELSRADAGSLYLLDQGDGQVDGEKVLRWKLAQNDSIKVGAF